jgi:iron complex outermembrane recepter protein
MNRAVLCATALWLVLIAPQRADAAAGLTAIGGGDGEGGDVGEIIVTATKQARSIEEVPISLAVVSGKTIEDRGFRYFTDLQAMVPSLQIDGTNGNNAITMRGLGSGASNLAFEQSVGLFVDGVYSGRARSLQVPLLDVERVEILRGPQGALFGKNTNAGAISLISRAPTDVFHAEIRAGGEPIYGGYGASGFVSGPIADHLTARLSAEGGHGGAWMANRLTKKDEYGTDYRALRAQLKWAPTADFDATLKVEGARNAVDGNNLVFNHDGNPGCALCDMGRKMAGGPGVAQSKPAFFRMTRTVRREKDETKSGTILLALNGTVAGWQLASLTAYQALTADQITNPEIGPMILLEAYQGERSHQFSQELRATRKLAEALDLTAGVTYLQAKLNVRQTVFYEGARSPMPQALPTGNADRILYQHSHSISPYAILAYRVAAHLFLEANARYTSETKRARITDAISGPLADVPYDLPGHRQEHLWDYSAKARYQFTPDAQLYLSYATGTKGGGFVSNDGTILANARKGKCGTKRPAADPDYYKGCSEYAPEKAKSWELGGKFRFWGRRADLNVALFHTDFNNLQVSSYNGAGFTTGNAARARSRGVEVETNWQPSDHFSFGGALAYIDARYQDYPGGDCLYNAPKTCTPATNNLKGSLLLRAPKWKGSVYVQAAQPLGYGRQISARVSADYTSRSYFQANLNPLNAQNAYAKLDARIAYGPESGKWELAVIGRNLTNAATFSQAFDVPILSGAGKINNIHGAMMNAPRMISLEAVLRL